MARAVLLVALLIGCGRIGFSDLATTDGGGGDDDAPLPEGRWRRASVAQVNGCGITLTGELWCWGQGFSGQLGIGDNPSAAPPTRVGTDSDWIAVEADVHTCGIREGGTLWCWGRTFSGALGSGLTTQDYDTPQQVSPGALWKSVAVGDAFTCAIRMDDTLWCWGAGGVGQLGQNGITNEPRPVETIVVPGQKTAAVALGSGSACAITEQRALYCWGQNNYGQLGDGSSTQRRIPVPIAAGSTWSAVTVGLDHTCAIEDGGVTWCWGRNFEGQLGDGSVSNRDMPTGLVGVPMFVELIAADLHTCGRTADGEVWCWGNARQGRIAGIDAIDSPTPSRRTAPTATSIHPGGSSTCLIDDAAHLFCTGANSSGQTGFPAGEVHTVERSDDRTDWAAIFAHATHTCGVLGDRRVECWGRGSEGQMGDGSRLDRQTPAAVGSIMVDRIEINQITTVGLSATTAYAWGYDLQNDTVRTTPMLEGATPRSLALGDGHVCHVTSGGTLLCNGNNSAGQLGDGTTTDATTAVTLPGNWNQVAAWKDLTCGIDAGAGNLQCWGDGPKTGTNNTGLVMTPTDVAGIPTGVTRVVLGDAGGCALVGTGELWCWGVNSNGQVGDGSTTQRLSAVRIGTRTDWRDLDAGDLHVCAIPADGTLWCWGHDDEGQLGSPALVNLRVPTQVGAASDWKDVASGEHFTCAIKTDGTRWCFGANGSGQLGNGRAWLRDFTVVP